MKARTCSNACMCLLAAAIAIQAGCSMIASSRKNELPLNGQSELSGQQFTVEVASRFGAPQIQKATLSKGLTVQGALTETGAIKRYRTMEVTLYRFVPQSGQMLRLACEFQNGKKEIKFEQDYAILPGDRIIVAPKSSLLDKAFVQNNDAN